jgi:uncharacterized ferredoxin-like protein
MTPSTPGPPDRSRPRRYPPNYDCGACGYATCAEFLHATEPLRDEPAELKFAGPTCNLRDIDLGIAIRSTAKTAASRRSRHRSHVLTPSK